MNAKVVNRLLRWAFAQALRFVAWLINAHGIGGPVTARSIAFDLRAVASSAINTKEQNDG